MKCPRCKVNELHQHADDQSGVILDVCRDCRGILFDEGELVQVLDVAARGLIPPAKSTERETVRCPKCQLPMTAFHYPLTVATVDMCRECHAVWLDRGEFREIQEIRRALKRKHKLQEWAPVPGIKGTLIQFVNNAISRLTTY
jgi:Zn-finger nucleic acid-binding protein